jgi:hypothetical protein
LGIGLAPSAAGAFLLLAAAGVGRSVFDVAGRTLLQRTAPTEVLARVFGVLEGLSMAGLALGSLLAPIAVALGGADAAFITVAALMPLLALVASKRLGRIDSSATVPVVELALLRSVPVTAVLPGPELERLARGLSPLAVTAGTSVITQGEAGDRFYVVAEGDFDVIVDGRHANQLHRGDAFGEIALLRDQPRNASVKASCDGLVYALGRDDFLAAVAGNTRFRDDAQRLADARLAGAAAVSQA